MFEGATATFTWILFKMGQDSPCRLFIVYDQMTQFQSVGASILRTLDSGCSTVVNGFQCLEQFCMLLSQIGIDKPCINM